jgi:hypothetical protein
MNTIQRQKKILYLIDFDTIEDVTTEYRFSRKLGKLIAIYETSGKTGL